MERRVTDSLADSASKQVRVSTSCAMELRAAGGGVAAGEGSSRNRIAKGEGNTGDAEKEQVIRWERFLPQKFLRVLLVENDDSTRHIVAALLRKCSYHVAAVADGLKAWEVLKEKNFNFDLILTEVAMPSLSGIGLLSKIMSNDLCKNIPVIMMSSHDSIGIVFKCMMKGAADFLVKPVRKNELRNLWQHVWRKYCSNRFGDGSHSQNTNQRKFEAESENEAASKSGSSNADSRTKTRDSSDKESETQNSCCKPDTEIESKWMQVEPPETNCRNVSKETGSKLGDDHDKAKLGASSTVNEKGKSEAKSAGIEIEVTVSVQDSVSTKKNGGKNGFYDGSTIREENRTAAKSKDISPESVDQIEETNKNLKEIIDFIGAATSKQCNYPIFKNNDYREDILSETASSSDVGKKICESGSSPTLWELSLRGPQGWSEGAFQKNHVLNHSDSSAFSRYRNSRIHISHPRSESSAGLCLKTGHSGEANCSMNSDIDNGKVTMFPHIKIMISSNGDGNENPIYSQLSCGIENADTSASGAVIKNACLSNLFNLKPVLPHPQHGFVSLPNLVGIIPSRSLYAGYDAMLNPIFSQEPPTSIGSSSKETGFHSLNPYVDKYNDLANNILCDKFQCSAENHHHLQPTMGMRVRTDVEHEDLQLMMHTPRETANQHCNVNFGITGINDANGSNGINEDTSATFNNGAALESGNEDGFQGCNSKGLDCDRSQRDAALTRFRLKRKDRCFEKKVRYHSRKKLAEQQP